MPANLGIEIAPQAQLEGLLTTLDQGDKGKGKEVAERVDVGKVAEKVVKNVRFRLFTTQQRVSIRMTKLMG